MCRLFEVCHGRLDGCNPLWRFPVAILCGIHLLICPDKFGWTVRGVIGFLWEELGEALDG